MHAYEYLHILTSMHKYASCVFMSKSVIFLNKGLVWLGQRAQNQRINMHKFAYVCKGLLVKYALKSYFVVLTLKYDYKNTTNMLFQITSYLKIRVGFCRIRLAKGQIRPCLVWRHNSQLEYEGREY